MRDIHFSGIICAGAKQAIYLNGLPELPLRNIAFHNSVFTAKKGQEVNNAENVSFEAVTINGKQI